jgi:hypothetical protein
VIASLAIGIATYTRNTVTEEDTFRNKNFLSLGMELPVLWIYIDTSDVNSRYWSDFGNRSSRAINIPFLNVCYERLVNKNRKNYRVEVIGGLSDLAIRLGGWDALPKPLQSSIAPVGEAEINWIRAAVLKKFGGLWVNPSVVAMKAFPKLPSDKVAFFGSDDDETYSGPLGTAAPSLRLVWSPKPKHPLFVEWEAITWKRVEEQMGGRQFRRDEKSDVVMLGTKYNAEVTYFPTMELTRKPNGKRIQLSDLLMSGQEGNLPFVLTKDAHVIPVPYGELLVSREYGWFLRMNEEQILASDLTISALLRVA